jgi:hypothetical protein
MSVDDRPVPEPRLTARLRDLPPSGTMAVGAEIRRRRARGIGIAKPVPLRHGNEFRIERSAIEGSGRMFAEY